MSRRTLSRFGRYSPEPYAPTRALISDVPVANPHNSSLANMSDYTLRPSFIDCWTTSGHQKSHISALERSPSGTWLLSASEDATVLFLDFRSGWVVTKLTLDGPRGRFEVLCAVWCSETIIITGGSNGLIYILEFQPQNDSNPISLRSILSPMPDQIKCLAVDASQTYLAVAYGTQVAIYQRAAGTGFDSWSFLDRIAKPYDGEEALVHAILFFGQTPCSLLVGYSGAGMTIWRSPQRFVYYDANRVPNICRIGDFALSGTESFIAMTTLDQSAVTYPMTYDGPSLEEINIYDYPDKSRESPALPIAITSSNLILSGTAVGDVSVLYPNGALAFSLHQGKNHVIRAITTYGDFIAVASSGPSGILIKCYMTQTRGDGAISWGRGPAPEMKRVTILDALAAGKVGHGASAIGELPTATITELPQPAASSTVIEEAPNTGKLATTVTDKALTDRRQFIDWLLGYTKRGIDRLSMALRLLPELKTYVSVSSLAIGFAFLTVILSTTPPGVPSFKETQKPSDDTRIYHSGYMPDDMWVFFGIRYFCARVGYQFGSWYGWMIEMLHACTFGLPAHVRDFFKRKFAAWIREQVPFYRELSYRPETTRTE
ncbi:hypothetical protein FRC09_020657 [Ceratobasidium sp. 395]|nr:hypothetical protein FRC09_020657 [Ceratobasidium sp. 395]